MLRALGPLGQRWTRRRTGAAARTLAALTVAGVAGAGLVGCVAQSDGDEQLRLGYFANVTHALPILGVANGDFQQALGATKLVTQVFNAGPAAIEALLAGSIDAAYVGPSPTINAFGKTDGAIRIISGAASGGVQFVVKPTITEANLKGKNFATPQLGNTQDVALRYWLKQKGLSAPASGIGDVSVTPTENPLTLDLFKQGRIDGAWVPEPWASRLVYEGGGTVLVNEASLWPPDGQFVTTHLIVATSFLNKYPETVKRLLTGQLATLNNIQTQPIRSRDAVNDALKELTGKLLPTEVLARSWANLTVTLDPIATSLAIDQSQAEAVGLAKPTNLNGIYDLTILNGLLTAAGKPTVSHRLVR